MRTRVRAGLTVVAALVAVALLYGTLVEPNRPVLRRIQVPCPGLRAPFTVEVFSDVDFPRAAAGRALATSVAEREHPDAIFVAGDFLDRLSALENVTIVARAAAELAALPAPSGRFLALGEEESERGPALRAAWAEAPVVVGDNDAHELATPGGPVDLFVADRTRDPAPWGLDRVAGKNAIRSAGRHAFSWVTYRPAGSRAWQDIEITLAFRIEDADSFLDLRFGWSGEDGESGGTGWRLVRHAYDRAFYLSAAFSADHRLSGRTRSGYVPATGIWHRARLRIEDDGRTTHVRARLWPEQGREPAVWLIDARDTGPGRRVRGTIGFGARAGRRAIADLCVRASDGRVLLDERFDERSRFDADWLQPSRLAAWARTTSGRPKLVLAHHPDVAIDLALIGAPPPALVIAGHTHGGQVALPVIGPLFTSTRLPRSFASGLGSWRGIPLFVTPGIGTSVVPVRLGVPPEVDLVTLTPDTMRPPGDPR